MQLFIELPSGGYHLSCLIELTLSRFSELHIGYPFVEERLGSLDQVATEERLEVLFHFHFGLFHLHPLFWRQEIDLIVILFRLLVRHEHVQVRLDFSRVHSVGLSMIMVFFIICALGRSMTRLLILLCWSTKWMQK